MAWLGWWQCNWEAWEQNYVPPVPRPGSGKGRGITKPPLKKRRKRR